MSLAKSDLIERLLRAFPLSRVEVKRLIATAPRRYKIHSILKRNGRGTREIAQPTAELKAVQRWIVAAYLSDLPLHDAAKAYVRGSSIIDHASPHATNQFLLKLDFKNFFPSILGSDIVQHLRRYTSVTHDEATAIARLLTRWDASTDRLVLSIGAPSSPYVSNTILFAFDKEISKLCQGRGVIYTRYADDLAFSSNRSNVLDAIKANVVSTIEHMSYPRLELNESKTVFSSKKYNRQLTGITLSSEGNISFGRDKKRTLRAQVYSYSKGELDASESDHLRGLLSFAQALDPKLLPSLIRMVGEECITRLIHGSKL